MEIFENGYIYHARLEADFSIIENEDEYAFNQRFNIVLRDEDDILYKKIGYINLSVIKHNYIDNLMFNLDYEPETVLIMIREQELKGHINYIEKHNFCYIEEFKIDEEYRNMMIGSKMLNSLTDYLKFMDIKRVYLCGYPLDCKENKLLMENTEKKRVYRFYQNNGFKVLGIDEETNLKYFYKILR